MNVIDLGVVGELVATAETSQGTLGLVSYNENGHVSNKYFLLSEQNADGIYEVMSFNLVGELTCEDLGKLEVGVILESVEVMAQSLEEDRG
ncbi:MAG: hypothetical protein NC114_06225 [Ruminococcus flavefaciens]|nr:hypothetical protein [Ruminococcus flavefaciens]